MNIIKEDLIIDLILLAKNTKKKLQKKGITQKYLQTKWK